MSDIVDLAGETSSVNDEGDNGGAPKMLDFKIPALGVIISALTVAFSIGGLYFQVGEIAKQIDQFHELSTMRNAQITSILQNMAQMQGTLQTQQVEIDYNKNTLTYAQQQIDNLIKQQQALDKWRR